MTEKIQKQNITLSLPPKTIARLRAWLANQPLVPKQGDVVALAIEEFLDRRKAG